MSISLANNSSNKFSYLRQNSAAAAPLQVLETSVLEKTYESDTPVASTPRSLADINKSMVVFDDSKEGVNLDLNLNSNPFVSPLSPSDSMTSVAPTPPGQRPTLYHSAGMWQRSKKRLFCKKVDMRPLYYQHFLNIKKVSDYQYELLMSVLARAKRQGRVDDAITLSIFLYESSGLRAALDADVDLFGKWHSGAFKKNLRAKFSSERMLFKGYIDELNDAWRPLTSEELFELPILKMLSRTPQEILAQPMQLTGKNINQRTYFNTLVYQTTKDRGHTYY